MSASTSSAYYQPSTTAEPLSPERATATPWRRVLAYLTDSFILGVVGFGAGSILSQQFAELGPWGRLVGFCIAVVYFSFLDSRLAHGQSPGKRWLNLRVVDVHGKTISLGRAVIRSIVFAALASCSGSIYPSHGLLGLFPRFSAQSFMESVVRRSILWRLRRMRDKDFMIW